MKVKKIYLLLIACIVWSVAGINILRIGVVSYSKYISALNILLSVVVFAVFQKMVFGNLVKKHTKRILEYKEDMQFFLKFFDKKAFAIMAFMMTFGIGIRVLNIAPEIFIAVFYSGLGASLLVAGLLFGANYIKALNKN